MVEQGLFTLFNLSFVLTDWVYRALPWSVYEEAISISKKEGLDKLISCNELCTNYRECPS